MIKERLIAIYANTWAELTLNMIGYYHDHCWHYYAGRTEALSDYWHDLIYKELKIGPKDEKRFIFLCEEDMPLKPS